MDQEPTASESTHTHPSHHTSPQTSHSSTSNSPPPKNDIRIPKITSTLSPSPIEPKQPTSQELADGLEGKYVDEFGNILAWDGTVLGRVEGDLPSMVGRPVSATGEILNEAGENVGYVSENYEYSAEQERKQKEEAERRKPKLRSLAGALQTDDEGNIYNGDGQIIGKLNEEMIKQEEEKRKREEGSGNRANNGGGGTSTTPSPSEVYLDVKSTHDGIQLIIKIPTVFK